MNVSFFIEDKKYQGNLTRKQILEVVSPVTQCDLEENARFLDIYLSHKMNDKQSCFLGEKGVSARGFDFSFDDVKNSYCVNLPLPCSYDDFAVVFGFIKKLCAFLGTDKVLADNGKEYTTAETDKFKAVFDFINNMSAMLGKNKDMVNNNEEHSAVNIEQYPFWEQIVLSLKQTLETLKMQTDKNTIELSGITRPVLFNEKMLADIISSNDPVKNFSDFFTNIQNLDAYSANQKIYSGKYAATYTLKENETTVLPFKPKVESDALIRGRKENVGFFDIIFIDKNGDTNDANLHHELGRISHAKFIEKLPKEKYKFIDANQILIDGLSRKEIENILA